jgi:hypothetical protein
VTARKIKETEDYKPTAKNEAEKDYQVWKEYIGGITYTLCEVDKPLQ